VNGKVPEYWFAAKRYGWGWGLPFAWQGGAVLISWLIIIISGVGYFISHHSLRQFAVVMVMVLVALCYWKGESPRWRWGK
jgi:hypothetical protein